MEWLEGETLGQLFAKGGISPELVIKITTPVSTLFATCMPVAYFTVTYTVENVIIGEDFIKVIDVSAADQRSMSRYSTISKEALAGIDVGYIAGNLRICLNRCTADYSPLQEEIDKLPYARTLDDVIEVLDALKSFDPDEYEGEEESRKT